MVRKLRKPPSRKTYQNFENLEGICGGVSLWSNHFFAVHSNLTYDSETYDLMKLYFETTHSESSRTPAVELFSENSQRVKAVGYFHKRAPSWMFNMIQNVSLPKLITA